MRDEKRIERILYKLGKIWVLNKDQRFFQLLYNYTRLGTREKVGTVIDPFHYTDEELERNLDYTLKEITNSNRKKR
jgi:hypothetical protein